MGVRIPDRVIFSFRINNSNITIVAFFQTAYG